MYTVVFSYANGTIKVLGFAANANAASDMVDACAYDFVCKADGEERAAHRCVPPDFHGAYVITETTMHVEIRRKSSKTVVDEKSWFGSSTVEESDISVGWITASEIDGEALRPDSCWNPSTDVKSAPACRSKPLQRPPQPWIGELTDRISRKVKDE